MILVLRTLGTAVLRGFLPYPDLIQRVRVRRAARRLVQCDPWPADDDTSGRDVAQLALLRVLWLQKQTRRAVRGRHREAAALLARSALEATILGLYCLHSPDAVNRLKAAHLKTGVSLLAFLGTAGIVPTEVVKQALSALGPAAPAPPVRHMASHVDAAIGGNAINDLYDRLYVPTSTFYVHANPASMLRHLKADRRVADRPTDPWMRRSPVRLADTCVGLLAAAISSDAEAPADRFVAYMEAHYRRTMPPVAAMAAKGFRRSIKLAQVLGILRDVRELQSYLAGPGRSEPSEIREARIRVVFTKLADPDLPAEAMEPIYVHFTKKLIDEWAPPDGSDLRSS